MTRTGPAPVAIALLLIAWGLGASRSPSSLSAPPLTSTARGNDADLYAAIVGRMRAGEDYYAAAGAELAARDYARAPVFNWRLPTLAWIESRLPRLTFATILLAAMGIVASFMLRTMADGRARSALAAALPFAMLPAWFNERTLLMHELWAGSLILLSLACWATGRMTGSVLAGAAALSIREHSVMYVVVMATAAATDRRWREMSAWTATLALFAAFYTWHALQALPLIPAEAVRNSWDGWGGWPAALIAARTSVLLLMLPAWLGAIAVPLLWLGLARWTTPIGTRVWGTVTVYLMLFMAIGRPDNWYWGFLIAPLVPFGTLGWMRGRERHAPSRA